jgi:hypothetical protein
LLEQFRAPIADLQGKLAEIVEGPDSLGAIRDTLNELVQRLRDFNLGFLRESLDDVFASVRAKLEAVNPARVREAVESAFGEVLDALSLDQVFPSADIAELDADYQAVIDKLRALDPGQLVIDVVRPEFEAEIIPVLESFDLTPLFTALIARMRSLDEELRVEMERVNAAFQAMLDAAPSVRAGVDVGVGL